MAERYGINRSMISKWMKDKDKIYELASNSLTKKLLKARPSPKYTQLYHELFKLFKAKRDKGHVVDITWLWSKARRLYAEITGNPNATVRLHVIVTFNKRF